MSLINDALKKAARQRAEEQGEVIPPMPGGGTRRVSRQGEPMRTQTMILVGAAALILIVVSVVVTGIMMTSKPEPKPVAAAKPAPEAPTPTAAPRIIVQQPAVAAAVPRQAAPTPTAVPVVQEAPSPTPTPQPVVQAPPPVETSSPVAVAREGHNETIQAAVDGFHISGVRTAGAGSKALIDGHVYKLNEVVDKTSGLKLAGVDEDHLTFVDKDGSTYVKNF